MYRRIPMGVPRRSVAGRVMAVGDAAGQLKTTTGGGILYGIICARLLVSTILEARSGDDFNLDRLKVYDGKWKQEIGLELRIGLLLRAFFERVGDENLDQLLEIICDPSVSTIMNKSGDFDHHRVFIMDLLREPRVRHLAMGMARKNLTRIGFLKALGQYLDDLVELGFGTESTVDEHGAI